MIIVRKRCLLLQETIDKNKVVRKMYTYQYSVKIIVLLVFLLFLWGGQVVVLAQLRTAPVFSHHMVFQRDKPVRVWGKAIPGEQVVVRFGGEQLVGETSFDSTWQIVLPAQKKNKIPQQLIVSTRAEKIIWEDIVIGDVWLCLGQSNMQWPMKRELHYKEELGAAKSSLLRFYNPSYAGENIYGQPFADSVGKMLNERDFYKGNWEQSDSVSIQNMSAVGYYFGKKILTEEEVPVGLIDLSIGGAPIETFIRKEAFQESKQYATKTEGDWTKNKSIPQWVKERGLQNLAGLTVKQGDGLGWNHAYKPGFAFASGIASLVPYAIKGVIWYQGESNAQQKERVEEYQDLLSLMIDDYRLQWQDSKLPFFWVQLSSIDSVKYDSQLWPQFRDEQRLLLQKITNGGMAVSSDKGAREDVHPRNKKIIGERLALWAQYVAYDKHITPSGPLPLSCQWKRNGKILIRFAYGKGLKASSGTIIRGFSVDGQEVTDVRVKKNKIILQVKSKPMYVYYGWEPYSSGNLVNKEELPASTFKLKI